MLCVPYLHPTSADVISVGHSRPSRIIESDLARTHDVLWAAHLVQMLNVINVGQRAMMHVRPSRQFDKQRVEFSLCCAAAPPESDADGSPKGEPCSQPQLPHGTKLDLTRMPVGLLRDIHA